MSFSSSSHEVGTNNDGSHGLTTSTLYSGGRWQVLMLSIRSRMRGRTRRSQKKTSRLLTSQPIRRPAAAAEGAFRLTEKQHHSTGWVLQWGKRAIRVGHRWEKATQLSDKHALHVHMQAMRQRVLSKTAPAQKGLVKRAEMPDGAEAMEAWWKKLEHTKWSLGYTSAALDKSRKNCLADGILESAVLSRHGGNSVEGLYG